MSDDPYASAWDALGAPQQPAAADAPPAPTPAPVAAPQAANDPYAGAWDQIDANAQTETKVRAAAVIHANTNPKDYAEAIDLSKGSGLSPDLVAQNLPDFRNAAQREQLSGLVKSGNPLGSWLATPQNYAVAKDSIDHLVGITNALLFGGSAEQPENRVPSTGFHPMDWLAAKFSGDPTDPSKTTLGPGASFVRGFTEAGNATGAFLSSLIGAVEKVNQYTLQGQIAEAVHPGFTQEQQDKLYKHVVAPLYENAAQAAIQPNERQDIGGKIAGAGGSLANTLPQYFVGGAEAKFGEALIQNGPTLGARAIGYVVNALEHSLSATALPATEQAAQTAKRVEDAGGTGPQAALAAYGDWLSQIVANALPLGFRGGRVARAAQAVPAGAVANVAATQIANAALPENMQQSSDGASMVAGGLLPAILSLFHAHAPIDLRAQQEVVDASRAQTLDSMVKAAAKTPLKANSPAKFEEYLSRVSPDGVVNVPPEKLAALYQSANTDLATGLDSLGISDAYEEAQATGTDVGIPVAKYLARLTPEQHAALAPDARLLPSGSFHDAPVFTRDQAEQAIREWIAPTTEDRATGSAGQVYDEVYGQLLQQHGDSTAAQQATLVQSLYRTWGERTGVDPYALWQRFPLNVNDAGRMLLAAKDSQPMIDSLIAAAHSGKDFKESDLFGDSLIPAVKAYGGIQPDSVGGGDLRAADAHLTPGLLNHSGLTAERMAEKLAGDPQWASVFQTKDEYGRPDPHELVDLIRQELGGSKVYPHAATDAQSTSAVKRAQFNDMAQTIRAHFAEHADKTGEVIASLPIARQREIAQAAFHTPEGEALYQGGGKPVVTLTGHEVADEITPENSVQVAKEWFNDHLRGELHREGFPVIRVSGKSLRELKRGMRMNPEKVKRLPAIQPIIEHGDYIGRVPLTKPRKDDIVAFHKFEGDVSIGDKATRLQVLVGEDAFGNLLYDVFDKAEAPTVTSDRAKGAGASEDVSTLDQSVAQNEPDFNIRLAQPGDGTPRGQVTFGQPDAQGRRVFNISLLAGKDRSTFLHESAHAFMEIMGDLARDAGASDQIKSDFDTLMRYGGAVGDTPQARLDWWHSASLEERRSAHEKLAEGFEQYLMEGKAPSPALRRAFASFKVWLKSIYQTLAKFKTPISDDVRAVFDRMLASDDEIAAARKGLRLDALDTVSAGDGAWFHPDDLARIRQVFADANADAEPTLAAQVLRSETAAQKRLVAEERRSIAKVVEGEVRAYPEYRAMRWLRNGKMPDGSEAPKLKLDKGALLDDYGPKWIQDNLRGMYSEEGGVSPDQAAQVLGYSSGSELVQALAKAPKLADTIKAETDARVRERFPDPLTDGTLADKAMGAVHREKQAQALLLEVQLLERKADGATRTNGAILREVVRGLIAGKVARKISPNDYRVAEAKSGREAFAAAAKGDLRAALQARRQQLLNHLLYAAARDARAEADKAVAYLSKVNTPKMRAKLGKAGHDYQEQQDGILASINLRPMSGAAADRLARLGAWIAERQDAGQAVDLPESIIHGTIAKPVRDLTLSELRDVRDAIKNIRHLADFKNRLLRGKEIRDRKEVDKAVAGSINDGAGKHPRVDNRGDPAFRDKVRHALLEGRGLIGAPASLIAEMEGFHEGGALTENVMQTIRDAEYGEVAPRVRKAQEDSSQLWLDHYTPKELRQLDKAVWIPELRENWSKRRILNLLQNWGNEGNREAILNQGVKSLTPADVAALFKRLDARDGKFVQARWDYMDTYWKDSAAAHKRRTGLVPKKVEASPFAFTGKDGEQIAMKGGYFPLKYDSRATVKASALIEDEYNKMISGGTAKPKVTDRMMKERVGSGGNVVDLTIDHFDSAIRDTIRLTHLADAVNYAHQVLHGAETGEAFRQAGAMEYHAALKLWLKDVAAGEMGPRNAGERFLRSLRSNVVTAHLGLNPFKAIGHLGGLFVSSARIGPKAMMAGINRFGRAPFAMARYIHESSPYMRLREGKTAEAIDNLMKSTDPKWKLAVNGLKRAALIPITKVWATVERITWLAAESKGLVDFNGDVQKARNYADGIVSGTQGASEFIEKSALRRGTLHENTRQSEALKAVTTMMSYMSAKMDLLYRAGYIAHRDSAGFSVKSAKAVLKLTTTILLACTMDGMAYTLSQHAMPQNPQQWFQEAAAGTVDESVGTLPVIGHTLAYLTNMVSTKVGGQEPSYYDPGTPYEALVEDAHKGFQAAFGKKFNKAALARAGINTAGALFGVPSSQINNTLSALIAASQGQQVTASQYVTGYHKPHH